MMIMRMILTFDLLQNLAEILSERDTISHTMQVFCAINHSLCNVQKSKKIKFGAILVINCIEQPGFSRIMFVMLKEKNL